MNISTFVEYSKLVFNKYVEKELHTCERIDIIWDVYKHDSLKATTRDNWGEGIRIKVNG